MLDSRYGGKFTTHQEGREAAPSETLYRVRLHLLEPPQRQRELRGTVSIEGKARSLLLDAAKHTLASVIRESGF